MIKNYKQMYYFVAVAIMKMVLILLDKETCIRVKNNTFDYCSNLNTHDQNLFFMPGGN